MNEDTKVKALGIGAPAAIVATALLTGHPTKPPPVADVITTTQSARIEATKAVQGATLPSDDRVLYMNVLQQSSVMLDRAQTQKAAGQNLDAQRNIKMANDIVAAVKGAVK